MGGRKDRERKRKNVRDLNRRFNKMPKTKCPNCGKYEAHFVPPSMGDSGFFICRKNSGIGIEETEE